MALQTLQLDIHLLVSQLQVISQLLSPVKHIMTGLSPTLGKHGYLVMSSAAFCLHVSRSSFATN